MKGLVSKAPPSQCLLIVGVGLIGGSLGLALRAAGYKGEIVGAGSREANLQLAVECGAIDRFETDLKAAVSQASIVLLAVPMGAMRSVMVDIKDVLPNDAVITDAGSVKGSFAADARAVYADSLHRVVPGHPIAGSENSGVAAARANLFQQRRIILTPLPETDDASVDLIRELWEPTGAEVHELGLAEHDAALAASSHLPHYLSFALVDMFAARENKDDIFTFAAGGFRDFTRIAASDPVMWRDIALANSDAIVTLLDEYTESLAQFREQLVQGDGDGMAQMFGRAREARRNWAEMVEGKAVPSTQSHSE